MSSSKITPPPDAWRLIPTGTLANDPIEVTRNRCYSPRKRGLVYFWHTRGHEQTRKICNRPIVLSDQKVVFTTKVVASDVAGVHLLSVAAGGVESIPAGLSTPASSAPPPPPRILVALDLIALATSSGVASGYFSR